MKRMLLLLSLICLSAFVFADDTNSDINYSVTVFSEVDVSIDGNSVMISTEDFSWTGFCGGVLEDTITVESTVDLNAAAVCPGTSEILNTVLDDYRRCVSLLSDDSNSLTETFDSFREDMLGDFNGIATWFAHGVEASVSEHMSDFDAKIQNTFLPVQSDFETLEGRVNIANRLNQDLNIELRTCQVNSTHFREKEMLLIGEGSFWRNMFAVAIVVLLLMLLYFLGVFERFTGGTFGDN